MRILMSITLTAFFSLSAFSNTYEKTSFDCSLSGDQATITNNRKVGLNSQMNFSFIITSIVGTREIVRVEYADKRAPTYAIGIPSVVKHSKKEKSFTVSFDNLNRKESLELLNTLGTNMVVEELPGSFDIEKLKFKKNCGRYGDDLCTKATSVSQVHFEPSEHDGLSFHLTMTCNRR